MTDGMAEHRGQGEPSHSQGFYYVNNNNKSIDLRSGIQLLKEKEDTNELGNSRKAVDIS